MKILYHHRTTARDGSAVHIEGLIDALLGLGADVMLVAPGIASGEGEVLDSHRFGADFRE